MKKKLLALALALLMLVSALPLAALANDDVTDAQTRISAWDVNLDLVTKRLFDNEESAHWKYVAENNKNIADQMLTYTVFALYDDAWQNGFDNSISVKTAKDVLISLIDKVDANIGDSVVSEIVDVLETASDINDFIQKVNGYVEISEVLTSAEWTNAFKYLNYAIKAGNFYEEQREEVIAAYARILAVQSANELYLDYLQYVADNCDYYVLATAARELVADINDGIEEVLDDMIPIITSTAASRGLTTAIKIAADTNAYTAAVIKIYDGAVSVADALWNTSDQYAIMDQLLTSFYAETACVNWAKLAFSQNDYDKQVFAMNTVLSIREVGAQTLCDLKVAQSGGVIGKVKNQINSNVTSEYVSEMQFLEMARTLLFDTAVEDYKVVDSIVTAFGPVTLAAGDVVVPNENGFTLAADNGYFAATYNEYSRSYVKTAFLYNGTSVALTAVEPGKATAIVERLVAGEIEDYSFTDTEVEEYGVLTVPTVFSLAPAYTYTTGSVSTRYEMNDDYVYPVEKEVSTATITSAVAQVAVNEVKGYTTQLEKYINSIIEKIFNKIIEAFFGFLAK